MLVRVGGATTGTNSLVGRGCAVLRGMSERPSDQAIWASVAQTLRRSVVAHVSDPQARSAVIHLIGLATYPSRRGPDVEGERRAELLEALGGSAGQDLM